MRLRSLWLVALLASASSPVHAADPSDEGSLKYRQNLMSAIGAEMGAISDIVKYGLPFPDHVVRHAQTIAGHAELVPAAFERRVVDGPTDAKPAIWEKPDDFREKVQKMKDAASQLAAIASDSNDEAPGEVARLAKALGDACGDCHKSFRKPKEQSYKRAQ